MAFVVKDRVKESSTTTGTGALTLAGAPSSYQDFSAIGDGNTTTYAIQHQSADEWETGIGTYTAAGTLLSRDTVLESSNGGALVNFSAGTKDVFATLPAQRAVIKDASGLVLSADLGTGTPSASTVLLGNQTWATPATLGYVSGSGASGRVAVWNGAGSVTSYSTLLTNGSTLQIGSLSGAILDVEDDASSSKGLRVHRNANTTIWAAIHTRAGAGGSFEGVSPTSNRKHTYIRNTVSGGAPTPGSNDIIFELGQEAGAYTTVATMRYDGRLDLPVAGSGAGVLIGGDVHVYRSATKALTVPALAELATYKASDGTYLLRIRENSGRSILQLGAGSGVGWASIGGSDYNNSLSRLDISATSIYLNGSNIYPQASMMLGRNGDASSYANQKPSYQGGWQCSTWTGSANNTSYSYMFAQVQNVKSRRAFVFLNPGNVTQDGTQTSISYGMMWTADKRVGINTSLPDAMLDIRARPRVHQPDFQGTGLNDFNGTTAQSSTFTGTVDRQFVCKIDGTGTPNTFTWSKDGGSTWDATGVAITGGNQTLTEGVTVKWTATTGHTLNDYWEFDATYPDLQRWQDNGGTEVARLDSAGNMDAVSFSVGGSAGASGSFTTVDGKTVTVTNGLVTSIV